MIRHRVLTRWRQIEGRTAPGASQARLRRALTAVTVRSFPACQTLRSRRPPIHRRLSWALTADPVGLPGWIQVRSNRRNSQSLLQICRHDGRHIFLAIQGFEPTGKLFGLEVRGLIRAFMDGDHADTLLGPGILVRFGARIDGRSSSQDRSSFSDVLLKIDQPAYPMVGKALPAGPTGMGA